MRPFPVARGRRYYYTIRPTKVINWEEWVGGRLVDVEGVGVLWDITEPNGPILGLTIPGSFNIQRSKFCLNMLVFFFGLLPSAFFHRRELSWMVIHHLTSHHPVKSPQKSFCVGVAKLERCLDDPPVPLTLTRSDHSVCGSREATARGLIQMSATASCVIRNSFSALHCFSDVVLCVKSFVVFLVVCLVCSLPSFCCC